MIERTAKQTPITFLKKFFRKKRKMGIRSARVQTETLWTHLLIWFPVAGLLVLGWSAYLFLGINSESIFIGSVGDPEMIQTIDQSELRSALDFFEVRAAQFEALKLSPPDTVDPA